ncbi:hypothetical protein J6590_097109 [Homalodisca vitripennis]|nr:hypothetical protein J6590_097109 [Homalodisca vitripennis]
MCDLFHKFAGSVVVSGNTVAGDCKFDEFRKGEEHKNCSLNTDELSGEVTCHRKLRGRGSSEELAPVWPTIPPTATHPTSTSTTHLQ